MVSVRPRYAWPSRKDANELPPLEGNEDEPGMLVERKLKSARPAMSCWPKPLAF